MEYMYQPLQLSKIYSKRKTKAHHDAMNKI